MNAVKQKWFEDIRDSALEAAKELFGPIDPPDTLSRLKLRPNRDTAVLSWSMETADGNRHEIVAKRCWLKKAQREHLLYTEILPELGLATLRCFGLVHKADDTCAWLFIEHADGCAYDPDNPDHVALAVQWLSTLHQHKLEPEESERFPQRGPEYYAACLQKAHAAIETGKQNPRLSTLQRETLSRSTHLLEALLRHWNGVQELCALVPPCLIHGDFLGKNLRVHRQGPTDRLQVFDWDAACWGFPFLDLAEALLPTQLFATSVARTDRHLELCNEYRPCVGATELGRLIGVGHMFWALNCLRGHAEGLRYEWVDRVLSNVEVYMNILEQGMSQARLQPV